MAEQMFKVLFVDNSRTTRAAMSRMLETEGFTVVTAGTGVEAMELIKKEPFNLIIMDLYMPLMNGHEAARLIRTLPEKDLQSIPIIALTASNDVKDRDVAKSASMDEFVVKSTDHHDLIEVLKKYRDKLNTAK